MGIMMFLALTALVTSIRYYGRHRNLRIFTYYIAFSLTETLVAFSAFAGPDFNFYPSVLLDITYVTFTVFEFIVCNLFILQYIRSPFRKRLIRINGGLFLTFLVTSLLLKRMQTTIFFLESVFLVLPCLIYFYELFLIVSLKPLKNQPSFWVVTGILFLNACSIPLQFTIRFLGRYGEAAYSLNDILYCILFILLSRAYFCSPENPGSFEKQPESLF